jgi:hypothetical protein
MFKTFSAKTFASRAAALALAASCAFTMTLASGEAQAKRRDAAIIGAAVIGGLLVGEAIGRATKPRHRRTVVVDYVPVRHCWSERILVGYTLDGDPITKKRRVCER